MTNIQELRDRLEVAAQRLDDLMDANAGDSYSSMRLRGKVEGVRLAQSYADEMLRGVEPDDEAEMMLCAWAEYRNAYGIGTGQTAFAKMAFEAGWKARGGHDESGALR